MSMKTCNLSTTGQAQAAYDWLKLLMFACRKRGQVLMMTRTGSGSTCLLRLYQGDRVVGRRAVPQ